MHPGCLYGCPVPGLRLSRPGSWGVHPGGVCGVPLCGRGARLQGGGQGFGVAGSLGPRPPGSQQPRFSFWVGIPAGNQLSERTDKTGQTGPGAGRIGWEFSLKIV